MHLENVERNCMRLRCAISHKAVIFKSLISFINGKQLQHYKGLR
jgi:hypothetical protein